MFEKENMLNLDLEDNSLVGIPDPKVVHPTGRKEESEAKGRDFLLLYQYGRILLVHNSLNFNMLRYGMWPG